LILARHVRTVDREQKLDFLIEWAKRESQKRKESERDMVKKECPRVDIDWVIDWAERQVASRVCQEKKKE
jgi:hypothetical protein